MLGQIPARIPEPDRSWFAIASYNMGYGHLEDARVITQGRGGNPDSWVEVRENLPLLSDETWYLRAKNGYARGWEAQYTVDRVRQFANVLEWRDGTARHQPGGGRRRRERTSRRTSRWIRARRPRAEDAAAIVAVIASWGIFDRR